MRMPFRPAGTQWAYKIDGRFAITKRMELGTFVLGKRFAVIGKYKHGLLISNSYTVECGRNPEEFKILLKRCEISYWSKHNSNHP